MLPVPRTTEANVLSSQVSDRCRQRDVGVDERLAEHVVGTTQRAKDRLAAGQEDRAEGCARRAADDDGVERERLGARSIARAQRPTDRRGDATAHGPGRQHLHQHDHGENEGDRRQLRGSQDADVGRLADRHQRHDQHGGQVGQRQAQQRRQDRAGKQGAFRALRGGRRGGHATVSASYRRLGVMPAPPPHPLPCSVALGLSAIWAYLQL